MERRLRHLGRALGAAGAAEPAPTKLFRQHDDGTIVHEDLLDLLEQEQAAAQAKDYRAAQLLRDTWEVLRPKPRLTLEECAPTDRNAADDCGYSVSLEHQRQQAALAIGGHRGDSRHEDCDRSKGTEQHVCSAHTSCGQRFDRFESEK